MQAVIASFTVLLQIFLSKIMEQKFPSADRGFCIRDCFKKELFTDLLFCNRFSLHEFFQLQNIIVTIISNTVTFTPVASCPPCLLVVTLKAFWYIIMNYEPYVRFINPHSK